MIDSEFNSIKLIDIGEADYSLETDNVELIAVGTPAFAAPEI